MEAAIRVRQRAKKAPTQGGTSAAPPKALIKARSEMLARPWNMSSDGIFVVQNGRVKECNHFLAARAGYAMDEIEGTSFASFFDRQSTPEVERVCRQITSRHETMSLPQALLMRKDGKGIEVELKACACRFGGKPAVLVTLSALANAASEDSWDADLDGFFVSEETPLPFQLGGDRLSKKRMAGQNKPVF